MKTSLVLFLGLVPVLQSSATVLTGLPTPVNQGGMIHVKVSLESSTLTVALDAGTPELKPLSVWKPGDSLEPSAPWYATLDPSQGAGMFNNQYGFLIDYVEPGGLPVGAKILINWISGTAGLESFRWNNSSQLFEGMLGTDGSSDTWDWSEAVYGMTHPVFVMPQGSSGPASATLGFTVTDASNVPLPGFTSAQTTLSFTAVPEPSALVTSTTSLLLLLRRRRSVPTS